MYVFEDLICFQGTHFYVDTYEPSYRNYCMLSMHIRQAARKVLYRQKMEKKTDNLGSQKLTQYFSALGSKTINYDQLLDERDSFATPPELPCYNIGTYIQMLIVM